MEVYCGIPYSILNIFHILFKSSTIYTAYFVTTVLWIEACKTEWQKQNYPRVRIWNNAYLDLQSMFLTTPCKRQSYLISVLYVGCNQLNTFWIRYILYDFTVHILFSELVIQTLFICSYILDLCIHNLCNDIVCFLLIHIFINSFNKYLFWALQHVMLH